eukprot:GHVS01015139.1.p1 GENE.GHVS01015139.1~~GHVS01015139.1.p1  ORF type:complete len:394 (+),score=44.13 GHVS01015139.1:153-1334(+)
MNFSRVEVLFLLFLFVRWGSEAVPIDPPRTAAHPTPLDLVNFPSPLGSFRPVGSSHTPTHLAFNSPLAKLAGSPATVLREHRDQQSSTPEWHYTGAHGYHWPIENFQHHQSPINIDPSTVQISHNRRDNIAIHYADEINSLEVENNGHTIQVNPSAASFGSIVVDGVRFHVRQFHFHSLAEHSFGPAVLKGNGTQSNEADVLALDAKYKRRYLDMHIVHTPDDQGDGRAVVLGITFTPSASNTPNPFLASLLALSPFPPPRYQHAVHTNTQLVGGLSALFARRPFTYLYRYKGSLTTPPLTEGVTWLLLDSPVEASQEQLTQMRKALFCAHGEVGGNYRLIQNSPLVKRNSGKVTKVVAHLNRPVKIVEAAAHLRNGGVHNGVAKRGAGRDSD